MIHNKHYEILKQFIGDYEKDIYGRELVGKVDMSQKGIALELIRLEKEGILRSRKSGNRKYFRLNKENPDTKDLLVATEITRKIEFINKHKVIASIFKQDDRIVGTFGSYAKGTQKQGSDLDVFIVGKQKKDDYDQQGEIFDMEISLKYFTHDEFIKMMREKNNLLKEILQNHIILFNAESFVDMIWRNYYGFD